MKKLIKEDDLGAVYFDDEDAQRRELSDVEPLLLPDAALQIRKKDPADEKKHPVDEKNNPHLMIPTDTPNEETEPEDHSASINKAAAQLNLLLPTHLNK